MAVAARGAVLVAAVSVAAVTIIAAMTKVAAVTEVATVTVAAVSLAAVTVTAVAMAAAVPCSASCTLLLPEEDTLVVGLLGRILDQRARHGDLWTRSIQHLVACCAAGQAATKMSLVLKLVRALGAA